MTIKICCCDGGGIRGLLPARVLQHIEEKTGRHIASMFDMLAGTSTGGIIAIGLTSMRTARSLGDLYAQRGAEIFANPRSGLGNMLLGPKYDATPLESVLKETLGNSWLSQTWGTHLMVPSYCVTLPEPISAEDGAIQSTREPFFFKSWQALGDDMEQGARAADFDFPLWQVARATSAAPTYFSPAEVTNAAGKTFLCVDGGTFDNNPAMSAYAAAKRLYPLETEFIVVSLGTGSLEDPIDGRDAAGWGEAHWIKPIISIMMDGSADKTSYYLDHFLPNDHYRLEISLGTDDALPTTVDEAFDCATPDNITRLEALAQKLITDRAGDIEQIIKRITL